MHARRIMPTKPKKPFDERSDLEKLKAQWTKLHGLHGRDESSAAIVRAATAAEIAANFVIRKEFEARSQFDAAFVDSLLKWANGLDGKMTKLLDPLSKGQPRLARVAQMREASKAINENRNRIVHRGEFANPEDVEPVIARVKTFIETLVQVHVPDFTLDQPNASEVREVPALAL
jgi:hypothetical protein